MTHYIQGESALVTGWFHGRNYGDQKRAEHYPAITLQNKD